MSEADVVNGLIKVPSNEVALLLECGYLYMEMNRPREAEEVFAGVAHLVPHSDIPLICMGNLFFSQGRYERALRFHRDALKRNPESVLAQTHVGEALLFSNKRQEARDALNKAVEMAGEGTEEAAFADALLDAMAAEVI